MRKILLYIVFGETQGYYDGAKFSLLTFMNWVLNEDPVEIVILTENPDEFESYPVTVFPISEQQRNEWSLDGKYNFRIKNRGMAYVMDQLELREQDKILFLDTDTYFFKSPLPLFDLIQPYQALFYLNEGLIYNRKRFKVYIDHLEGKSIQIDNDIYELSKDSAMWGSLMVGIMPNMRPSLDWADKLMQEFVGIVPAHTIEPFSLAESLLRKYRMIEGKKYVSLYSTSRKKEHALKIISEFLNKYKELPIDKKIMLAQKVVIKRNALKVVNQRILQLQEMMSRRPIPILMYHSIEKMPKSTVMRSLHVSPGGFGIQMWLLNMLGYKGLSIRELTPYLNGEKTGKVVGITFDDGYQNNLINAAPILKKYNYSATCYLVSQRIGTSNTWDRDKGITQRPLMTQSEVQEWLNLGLDIGAHTQTHPSLEELSEQQSQEEIFNCKADLEHIFKVSIKDFCYPFGRFNKPILNMTKEAGYITATTMIRGRALPQSNKLTLPRIPITHHTLPHLFLTKILTKYEDKR